MTALTIQDVSRRSGLSEIAPFAHDPERERRLWEATNELLEKAAPSAT